MDAVRGRGVDTVDGTSPVLSHGPFVQALPIALAVIFLVMFLAIRVGVNPPPASLETAPIVLAILVFFTILLPWLLFLEAFGTKIVLSSDGVKKKTVLRGVQFLKWEDIETVYYSSSRWQFVAKGRGTKITLDESLDGLFLFAEAVDARLPPEKSVDASDRLRELLRQGRHAREHTSGLSVADLKPEARLPSDFLEKRWVIIFRRMFGPVSPGFLIFGVVFLSLFVWMVFEFLRWVFTEPTVLATSIAASAFGAAAVLVGSDYRPPDIRLPIEEIKRSNRFRDRFQAILFLAGMLLLAAGMALCGVAGLAAVLVFFGIGAFATLPYLGLTSRIHLCACCAGPTMFRRFRGRWTCVVCGRPR